ncbi:gp4 [Mycobacterium phage PLot]|uniref:Uncharacterized protein n=18 Tax=Plotvirus TaxID=2169613 RepID=Q19YE5_9CAUD|nr:gp4 [Mycobacterium phage Troll4]YP_002241899.1 gp4 [Mycobacterium phage Gumball]YP_655200.1 gp4 [Mycobacterium phage PBI1]YP_655383.1 gp4 [Mycobacterium phage PLot]ACD49589.1 capsid accessory protein [Mycobacterium phage Adjutor]ACI06292.1 capsid accessory protein [Mycobacterium phage Butterscotch]AEK10214.1 capsid accessory protein [Mycobacterium phage SirHarley]AER49757.1 capsid accessory protein [Mycobacterium phage Nova]AVP43103.1 capsid accessory protein [Mycobacterium phage BigMama
MAKGVKKLPKRKGTNPIPRDKWNSDDIARRQLEQDQKLHLTTKGPHTGTNDSFK